MTTNASDIRNVRNLLGSVPAPLGDTALIASTNTAIKLSRLDPWMRPGSTAAIVDGVAAVPAFRSLAGVISFDLQCLNGSGKLVPNAIVKLTVFAPTTGAPATTSVPALNAGVLGQIPFTTTLVAAGAPVGGNQFGRTVVLRADSVGRLTGTLTMDADDKVEVLVEYLGMQFTVLVSEAPAV
jgi:hypothetical protein